MPPQVISGLPTIFSYKDAKEHGLSDRKLYSLRDEGEIEQLGRGLFCLAGTEGDPDLLEIAFRSADATLCLGTALARQGLSDEIPAAIDVALPRQARQPAISAPARWHRFDPKTFAVGRDTLPVGDLTIGIYSAERSICDAFRLQHLEGTGQAVEALKRWLRWRGAQPSTVLRMARRFGPRAETPIREALEVLL